MSLRGFFHITARFLSNVISPPVVAAVFGYIVAMTELPFWTGLAAASVNAFWMCVVPLGVVIFLARTGRINDLHMSNSRSERRLPYLVGLLCAFGAFVTFYLWGISSLLTALSVCNIISLAALGIINNYWLISNHTASIMSAAVFSVYLFGWQAGLFCLVLVSLVIWARWLLRKHTPSQLAAGLLVGAVPVMLLAALGWIHP